MRPPSACGLRKGGREMSEPALLWQLFHTFFVIGMFTIGGGYAMLSLIETQVVSNHGWMSEGAFTDIVGISQMTPGPVGINCATYVGHDVMHAAGASEFMSIIGSMCATAAVVLPSFIIMMIIVRLYVRLSGNAVFKGVMSGLRPVVVGLIGAAALILIFNVSFDGGQAEISLMTDNFPDWKSWVLFAVAFIVSMWTKASPIAVIAVAGISGLILY